MDELNSADILNELSNIMENNPKQIELLTEELSKDPLTIPSVEIIESNPKLKNLTHLAGALTVLESLLGSDISLGEANRKLTDAAMIEYIPCLIKRLQK